MAGQYAKPRSADTETRDGVTLPQLSWRQTSIGRASRPRIAIPIRQLLLRGYERSALTLNFRPLVDRWRLRRSASPRILGSGFRAALALEEALREDRAVDFRIAGLLRGDVGPRRFTKPPTSRFYTSHEVCTCCYEQAQTRYIPRAQRWYNLSTHMPWIGMRTAALDGAHVEFFRGISNPLGIKVGPSMSAEWVQGLLATLNPNNEPGRIVLIHRMGAKDIEKRLPPLIQAVRATGGPVLWICDPMHGNTETATSGLKTRRFENIVSELEAAFRIHRELGSWLGGVHFELTG